LVQKAPIGQKEKIAGKWYVDERSVPGLKLARSRGASPPSETKSDVRDWTPRSLQRDAEIRQIVADADAFAADQHRLRVGLSLSDNVFCAQRGKGFYPVRFGVRTLQRWRKTIAAGGALPEKRGRKGGLSSIIGAEAWNFFVASALKLHVSMADAYRFTIGASADHPGDAEWAFTASLNTVRRRFKSEYPAFARDWFLEGPDKWRAKHLPKIDRRQNDLPANHTWEIDGTPANVLCRHGEHTRRPQVVQITCPASRMVVAVVVALSESTEMIRRAMWLAYKRFGAPKLVRVDQGKAFAGEGISDRNARKRGEDNVLGFVKMMQAEIHECAPRAGWAKGTVESLMKAIDAHDRLYPSYIGNRPANRRREADAYSKKHHDKLPTIEEYEKTLRAHLEAGNRRPRKDFGGLSPLQKFEATRISERRLPPHAEGYLKRRPKRVKVTNRGIGIRVGGKPIYFGMRNPQVWPLQGQRVVAYIDDDDLSEIIVTDLEGRPLFYAQSDGLVGMDAATFREAGKLQKKVAKARKQYFEDLDFSVAPTADAAARLKRQAAEIDSAKHAPPPPAEPVDVVTIFPAHAEQMKQLERRHVARRAVGAEDVDLSMLCPESEPVARTNDSLLDLFGGDD